MLISMADEGHPISAPTAKHPRRRPAIRRADWGRHVFVFLAVLLACVFFGTFFYYPFLQNVYWMFTNFTLLSFLHPVRWVGWANFVTFFHDDTAHQAFVNTFIYAAASVPLVLVLSLSLALALHYLAWGRTPLRAMVFLTYLMPLIAGGCGFPPAAGPVRAA